MSTTRGIRVVKIDWDILRDEAGFVAAIVAMCVLSLALGMIVGLIIGG